MADRLDYILDEYERRAAEQVTPEDQRVAQEVEFLAEFRGIADSVIVPTLEALAERLRGRGHAARVDQAGRAPAEHTRWTNVAVELVIQPSARTRSAATNCDPYVSFTAIPSRRVVEVHEWHTRGGGPAGEYELDALDEATVKHIAVDAVEKALAPQR